MKRRICFVLSFIVILNINYGKLAFAVDEGFEPDVLESTKVFFEWLEQNQKNSAIQYYKSDDGLLIKLNVIMAGKKSGEHYIKNNIKFTYDEDYKITGYEYCRENTGLTYAEIAKRGIEMLTGIVNGVFGEQFNLKVEVNVHKNENLTNEDINEILAQTDNTKHNYIVIFPQVSFSELKEDFPSVYSEYAEKKCALGYTSYISQGSGYIALITNNSDSIMQTAAHETMHLLGIGDIYNCENNCNFADAFDIMRYGALRKIRISNVHIYTILKSAENKKIYEWCDINEELQKYVDKNGLFYSNLARKV